MLLTPRGHEVVAAVLAMQASYERRWAEQVGEERWRAAREVLLDLFSG